MDTGKEQQIKSIFPSPQVANQLIKLVTSPQPLGWSHRSNATYFKEEYAQQVKSDIDKMIDTRNDIVYRYGIWCGNGAGQMSNQTLYIRINQSIRYLIERLDPHSLYRKWYETVGIQRKKGLGVVIYFLDEFKETNKSAFKAEEILPIKQQPAWMKKMDDWLEDDKQIQPFVQEKLALTDDEVNVLRESLIQLGGIEASVSSGFVRIIKVNV